MELKTIDINAKEWTRRSIGGSYQSCQVTVNYGLPDEITLYCPFEGGYNSYFEQMAADALKRAGYIPQDQKSPFYWLRENGVIVRSHKQEGCKEREVRDWGFDPSFIYLVTYKREGEPRRKRSQLMSKEAAEKFAARINAGDYDFYTDAKIKLA